MICLVPNCWTLESTDGIQNLEDPRDSWGKYGTRGFLKADRPGLDFPETWLSESLHILIACCQVNE